ncbi:hypothetical protein ZIOFF_051032 [Zingiber officinale]|uniref:Uncharacterized protein n=1 Tax=Zingiber officinale TaxID=94328 RepID=A0A8J5KQR7_ZINOF|nr:hypothetical protein ZIOFF_051032 [Zingiber officinale]
MHFLFQSILIFSLLAFFLFLAVVALGLVSHSLVALAADLSEEWGSHHGQRSSKRIRPAAKWLRGLLDRKKTGVGELPVDHKEKRRWGFGKSSLSLSLSRLQERLVNTTERFSIIKEALHLSDKPSFSLYFSLPKCCLVKLFSDALLKEIMAPVVRHPDTLTMETIKAGNKGYATEILVVTYNRHTEDVDDQSKFRILLTLSVVLEFWKSFSHVQILELCEIFILWYVTWAIRLVSRSLVALAADLSEEWGSHRGRRSSERIGPAARWLRGLLDEKKIGVGELPADHKEKRRWGFSKSSLSLSLDCRSDWRTLQRGVDR